MKRFIILLMSMGMLSCTQVEFCEQEHPHTDKLVVKLNWANVPQSVTRPSMMNLYMWSEGKMLDKQITASCESNFIADLPSPGKYKMMLISDLVDVSLIDKDNYEAVKAHGDYEIQSPVLDGNTKNKAPGNLFIVPLGDVEVVGNNAVITTAKVQQGVRQVDLKISLNNAAFLLKEAYVTMSGNASDLLLSKNEALNVNTNEILIPLIVGASDMKSQFSIFGTPKESNAKQILTVHVIPQNGLYQQLVFDVTKPVTDFEKSNPNKNIKLTILADGQSYNSASGTVFKLNAISVDGKVVERGGDI